MGRKTRDRSGEVLKIPSGRTGSTVGRCLRAARGLMLAPRLLVLVDLLFQPSLDSLSTVLDRQRRDVQERQESDANERCPRHDRGDLGVHQPAGP